MINQEENSPNNSQENELDCENMVVKDRADKSYGDMIKVRLL